MGALTLGLCASLAQAATLITRQDPNDTPGTLDMQVIGGQKDRPAAPLVVGLRTFHGWHDALLKSTGSNRIFVYFNINKDRDAEYVGEISTMDGQLVMTITGKGDTFPPIKVTRTDASTIRVSIPRSSPANPRGSVKIAISTTLTKSTGPCASACVDRAPDTGWLTITS
jgi:hypothetical protein